MLPSIEEIVRDRDHGRISQEYAVELLRRHVQQAASSLRVCTATRVLCTLVPLSGDIGERDVAEAYRLADLLISFDRDHPREQ